MTYTYFFFQAEDGIRDGRVTGVQTCALPISSAASTVFTSRLPAHGGGQRRAALAPARPMLGAFRAGIPGAEDGLGWLRDHRQRLGNVLQCLALGIDAEEDRRQATDDHRDRADQV